MAAVKVVQGTPAHRAIQVAGWALAAAVLVALPYYFQDERARIDQFTQVAAYAVAILGLNLVIGFSGQISLGHSAFVGIGAYTTVILVADHGWDYLATIPVAFALSFVVGLIVGLPALRIRGLYLAVVTLAVATVFPTLVLKYESLTGGANAKQARYKMLPPSWSPWDPKTRFGPVAFRYFVVVAIAGLMFLLARNLMHSRVGRAIIAGRDNSTSAAVVGVDLARTKTFTFGLSAAFAGVAGSLLMIQTPQASDGKFGVELAIFLIVALVTGGIGTLGGCVAGGLIYVFVPYYTQDWSGSIGFLANRPGRGAAAGVIYGALLLVFVFVLPGGLMDGLKRLKARLLVVTPHPAWMPRDQVVAADAAAPGAASHAALSLGLGHASAPEEPPAPPVGSATSTTTSTNPGGNR